MTTKRIVPISIVSAVLLSVGALAQAPRPLNVEYREVAGRLVSASLVDTGGWEKLAYLTTRIGNRITGSAALEGALAWASERMQADGLKNVRLQPVKVPHWVRGRESARVVAPVEKALNMLGLAGSIATPKEGITAPVVVVGSFDELEAMGADRIRGKIVLYDVPWPPGPGLQSYEQISGYGSRGASRAAKLGAVASLVRATTPHSVYTPDTRAMNYDPAVPVRIPAAVITVEDSAWIHQMTEMRQEVRVNLYMEAETLPDADSANVMGEIVGRERPDEIVVLGGHIDSWDVGQGAQDDGAGLLAAWQAVVLMNQLGLRPRRTVRAVGWTGHETGQSGGTAYRQALGTDVNKHVAAIAMDLGAERPVGFGFTMIDTVSIKALRSDQIQPYLDNNPRTIAAMTKLRQIAQLLEEIRANTIRLLPDDWGGVDIRPLMVDGVPGLGLQTVDEHYWDWHHSNADTLDKVDLQDFRKCVATLAVMAYILADMPDRL